MKRWTGPKGTATAGTALLALLLAGSPGNVRAQELVLPELPFTLRNGIGARASGMGFAHAAVVEDGSAMFYNPAGLSQVRRIELAGGLTHEWQTRDVEFSPSGSGGSFLESVEVSDTKPNQVSIVYPFPAYRGSLALGFAYQRASSLRSEYYRTGILVQPAPADPGLFETETFSETGGVDYWTFGIGGDVSPHVSLGATFSFISGSTHQDFQIGRLRLFEDGTSDVNGSEEVFLSTEERDANLSGFTGAVGFLARPSEKTRLGITVDFPQALDFDGEVWNEFEDQEKVDTEYYIFEDEITLPFSFLGGIAFTPKNFVFAFDARLTDWTQIDFEGPVRSSDRENAYRSTVDLNVGAEYQFSSSPTRIRAGFSSQPLPYKLMPGEIDFFFVPDDPNASDDFSYFTREYPEAEIDTDRYFLTVGAGTLIDNTVAIEFAYVHGIFERSIRAIREEWTTNRIVGTASFRF